MNTTLSRSPECVQDARGWIGRRLVLRQRLGGFEAGTPCVVMCAVDFGEGLLLWVKTRSGTLEDVGQFSPRDIKKRFHIHPPRLSESDQDQPGPQGLLRNGLVRRLTARVSRAAKSIAKFGVEFGRSFRAAQHASQVTERYLRMSDDELAARGMTRQDVSSRVFDIVYKHA